MTTFARRTMLLVLAAAVLSGCASIENKKRSLVLNDRVNAYTKAIRWGDFDVATRFVKHRDGRVAATDTSHLQGIRVTHYDYSVGSDGPESEVAQMTASFEYQLPSTATVRTVKQNATWWYEAESETWFLDSALPEF